MTMRIYTEIINRIIRVRSFTSYLEIGVFKPTYNFDSITCDFKMGVDPATRAPNVLQVTSDKFFQYNQTKFDLVFVDGDHSYEQTKKDMENALRATKAGGCILVHDCNPASKELAAPTQFSPETPWCGEVYRAYAEFTASLPYDSCCLDIQHGLGLIDIGQSSGRRRRKIPHLTWEDFSADRSKWLNLRSVEEWLNQMRGAEKAVG